MQQTATLQPSGSDDTSLPQQLLARIIQTPKGDSALDFLLKRSIDIGFSVLALILLAPLVLLICVLIVIDSHGPVLFSQERVGSRRRQKNGHVVWETCVFQVYKFRSMIHDADQSLHQEYIKNFVRGELEASEDECLKFKLVDDPRITRVGRLLRRTSLDELPQFLNVLKGDMSLVGPRPVPVYEVAEYDDPHFERLATLPGLTGLWQVTGRGNVTFEEMVELDIEYVHSRSVWLDIKLLMLTVPAVVAGRGAK